MIMTAAATRQQYKSRFTATAAKPDRKEMIPGHTLRPLHTES